MAKKPLPKIKAHVGSFREKFGVSGRSGGHRASTLLPGTFDDSAVHYTPVAPEEPDDANLPFAEEIPDVVDGPDTRVRSGNRDSACVYALGYDLASSSLFVAFQSGRVYKYFQVPPDVYQDFLNAPSKGKFLNFVIKRGGYAYQEKL